jgi:hypothetical protein
MQAAPRISLISSEVARNNREISDFVEYSKEWQRLRD